MAAIPGTRFNISGASGTQGLLAPESSWRCYVFPRGAWAAQGSAGNLITFDTAAIASRFAANKWIQVGINSANLRKVSAVGGNSIQVSGSAVTVAQDDRIFIIGSTQPTVTGGSATYLNPDTTIYDRDDDTSTRQTNSMITADSNGLISFYTPYGLFDCLVQDGNGSAQGYIADLPVGVAEAVSTSFVSVFGAAVTINAPLGITGSVTITGATSNLTVANNLTAGGDLSITGIATIGGGSGLGLTDIQKRVRFGDTATFSTNVGITGTLTVGGAATLTGGVSTSSGLTVGTTLTVGQTANITGNLRFTRLYDIGGASFTSSGISLSASWGTAASVNPPTIGTAHHGTIEVTSGNASVGSSAVATLTFPQAFSSPGPDVIVSRTGAGDSFSTPVSVSAVGTTSVSFKFMGTPGLSTTYSWTFWAMSRTG